MRIVTMSQMIMMTTDPDTLVQQDAYKTGLDGPHSHIKGLKKRTGTSRTLKRSEVPDVEVGAQEGSLCLHAYEDVDMHPLNIFRWDLD